MCPQKQRNTLNKNNLQNKVLNNQKKVWEMITLGFRGNFSEKHRIIL